MVRVRAKLPVYSKLQVPAVESTVPVSKQEGSWSRWYSRPWRTNSPPRIPKMGCEQIVISNSTVLYHTNQTVSSMQDRCAVSKVLFEASEDVSKQPLFLRLLKSKMPRYEENKRYILKHRASAWNNFCGKTVSCLYQCLQCPCPSPDPY